MHILLCNPGGGNECLQAHHSILEKFTVVLRLLTMRVRSVPILLHT